MLVKKKKEKKKEKGKEIQRANNIYGGFIPFTVPRLELRARI